MRGEFKGYFVIGVVMFDKGGVERDWEGRVLN